MKRTTSQPLGEALPFSMQARKRFFGIGIAGLWVPLARSGVAAHFLLERALR
jgi:hypothetical protein